MADNTPVDDFAAMFAVPGLKQGPARLDERRRLEQRGAMTERQRKRGAVRTTQINVRCSPDFRELVAGLTKHCDASIADVMEEALAMLAMAKGYEGGSDVESRPHPRLSCRTGHPLRRGS